MKRKIHLYFVLIAALAVILSTSAGVYLSYNSLENQARRILKEEAQGEAFRVTKIAPDGTVLYDSAADEGLMGNHLDREEITKALEEGEAFSIRASGTVMQNAIYYAARAGDGSILRLSMYTSNIRAVLNDAIPLAVMVTLVLIVFSAALAPGFARRITGPMEMSLKNADEKLIPAYDELIPFFMLLKEKDESIKAAIEDIKRRKQNMELVFSNMSEGMLYVDSARHIKLINPAAFKFFGLDRQDLRGQDLLYFSRDKKLSKAAKKAAAGKKHVNHTQIGGRILQISASPVYIGVCDEYAGIIFVISDVTEQKQAEKIRREFTANVSHELKTPLTSIMGYSELLIGGAEGEEAIKFAKVIHKESQHLMHLISHILELSELENTSSDTYSEEIDLMSIVDEYIESVAPYAAGRNITVTADGSGRILANYGIAMQIVRNLCDNAIKYNIDGGKVYISVSDDGEYVTMTVADTGVGIAVEDSLRIFERFYRVDKGRTSEGSGLGLAIVKHAAERLNADVTLKSETGKGTQISVRFKSMSLREK